MIKQLFCILLSVISTNITYGSDIFLSDQTKQERIELNNIEKLIKSRSSAERLRAAQTLDVIESISIQLNTVSILLEDPNEAVRIAFYQSASNLSSRAQFSLNDASTLVEILAKDISVNRIDAIFLNPNIKKSEIRELIEKCILINTLYTWYPLVSAASYSRWQQETFGYLCEWGFRNGIVARLKPTLIRRATATITEPQTLVNLTPLINEYLQQLPPRDQKDFYSGIRNHKLLGLNKPLSHLLQFKLEPTRQP